MFAALPAWLFFALLSALFAALTNIFVKLGVAQLNSNMATLIRVAVIIIMTTAIVVARNEWVNPSQIASRTWLFLVLSGVATGLSWLCMYYALSIGEVALVTPVDKLSVVLAMILGVVFLGESLSGRQWLGGALILAGVLLVAAPAKNAAEPAPAAKTAQ